MFYVYVLRCKDDSLYTGYTNDLDNRIKKHNEGKGAKYTRGRRPIELVYSCQYKTKSEAMKAEAKFKKLNKNQKIKLINSATLKQE